ncbi:MAG: SurA N-terminal domain-containing protein [Paludibacteraceae bacterium]|nr:SurA N-terminal domain-containing protein [Paludibacteraceae bacterium]
MATLQKIRNHGALLLIIVGLAMLAFILGDAINSGSSFWNLRNRKVAVINGQDITPEDYQNMIDETTRLLEIQYNRSNFDEETTVQIREQVWQQMLLDKLLTAQAEKIGMAVTDEEIDQVVERNKENLREEFLESPAFRKSIYVGNLQQKYQTLVQSLIRPNKLDAEFAYEARTNMANAQYVLAPYSAIADSTIEVSDSELKALYKERKHLFKQKPNREIAYVLFADAPSKQDFEDAEKAMKAAQPAFQNNGVDTLEYIKRDIDPKSGLMYEQAEYSSVTVPEEYKDFAFGANVQQGAFTDIEFADNTYAMARIVKCNYYTSDSVKFSMRLQGDTTTPAQEQWVRLEELPQNLKDSIDKTPVGQSFTFTNQAGVIECTVDSLTTPTRKVELAVLKVEVRPSSKSHNANYQVAKQFAVNNKTEEAFREAAEKDGLTVMPQANLLASAHTVGQLPQSREVVRWAFQTEEEGTVSDVMECGDQFVVAVLVEINDGDYVSLEKAAAQLRPELINRKKAAQLREQLAGKTLAEAAKIANAEVANADSITLSSYLFGNAGVEPAALGTALAQAVNTVSEPIEGNQGVLVVKTTAKMKAPGAAKMDLKAEKQNLQQRYAYAAYQALNILERKAEIKDNRGMFY